jgi:DNA uptake protein ComE-like DNA-binding protein
MLPISRNENSKTPGKNVSKTPGKMPPPSAAKFTTVKKQAVNRFNSFCTPSKAPAKSNPQRRTDVPQATDMSCIDSNTFLMNCSTSTEFDAPAATPSLSVVQNATMPSFSPLMRQIEQTIDLKLNSFMDTLKNQTVGQPTDIAQFHETIRRAVMKDVGGTSEMNSTFDFPEHPTTSTVMRKPAERRLNLETTATESTNFLPASRTSRRLNTTDLEDNSPFNFTAPLPVKKPNRRLTSVRDEAPTRRSTRISMLQEIRDNKNPVKRKSLEKPKEKKEKTVLPSFLDRSSTRKISKSNHKKEVLDLLNTGTMNQLKLLPRVGLKTAYQLLTYRTIHGKFKKLDDVKNVPGMKGKIWENFLEVS